MVEDASSWRHFRFTIRDDETEYYASVDINDNVMRRYELDRVPNKEDLDVFERYRLLPALRELQAPVQVPQPPFSATSSQLAMSVRQLVFDKRIQIHLIEVGEFTSLKLPTFDGSFADVYVIAGATVELPVINSFVPLHHNAYDLDTFPIPQLLLGQRDQDSFLLQTRLAVCAEIRHQLQIVGAANRVSFSMDRIPAAFINYLLLTIPNSAQFLAAGRLPEHSKSPSSSIYTSH